LGDLTRDRTYEVVVVPYNSQGLGPPTPPATVYVGEAVPTGRPRDVTAEALSSTEVRLSWRAPPAGQQNGELLGYKVTELKLTIFLTTELCEQDFNDL
jgi:protein sidekick